jgi:hypothetical protein
MKYYLTFGILLFSFLALNGQEVSKKEMNYKPVNLEEAVIQLTKILPDTTQQKILSMTEDEFLGGSHFGLGMWIRNNWGLWRGGKLAKEFNNKGIFHPDDMSGIILKCYYRQLHNQDWGLDEQIKLYKDYWTQIVEREKRRKEIALKNYNEFDINDSITILMKVEIDEVGGRNAIIIESENDWVFNTNTDLEILGIVKEKYFINDSSNVFFKVLIFKMNYPKTKILMNEVKVGDIKDFSLRGLTIIR